MTEMERDKRRIRDLETLLQVMTAQRDSLQKRLDAMTTVADSGTMLHKFNKEFEAVRNDAIERVVSEDE